MIIALDGFAAHVAHRGTTRARHLIAALSLIEALVTAPALAQHCFTHAVLDVRAHARLAPSLHFVTAQRNVTWFAAQSVSKTRVCQQIPLSTILQHITSIISHPFISDVHL